MLFSTFTPSVPVNITTAQNTTLYAWGDATGGQLGTGTTISQSQPVAVSNFLNGQSFAQIATGISHNLAIDTTGGLWAWGRNSSGQLGTGTTINAANPVKISVSGLVTAPATWTSISLGFTSLAIRSDGTLWAWGYGNRGGLGDGTTVSKSSPVQIGTSSWTMVSTGYDQSAAIDITGRLFVWGGGFTIPAGHGSIGDGTTLSYSSPVQIGTSSWSFVNLGQNGNSATNAAIDITGRLFTWGDNQFGAIGDGTTVNKSSPVQIGTSSWSMISLGYGSASAVTTNGLLFGWGNNASGQLGTNNTTTYSSPVQIGTSSWTMISEGGGNTVGLRIDGALFSWGSGSLGAIGDGTTTGKSSPVQIGTSSWSFVSAAFNLASFAIRADNTLWAWGDNLYGQLGDGTTINKSSPVQIGSGSWTKVLGSASSYNNGAVNPTGKLYIWGYNTDGELGDGTTINKSSPIQVAASMTSTTTQPFS